MPEKQNRKLAAILFADIVGYTSLMQKDEHTASTLLRHFQKQLEEKVKAHQGRIVNFYGDGALCTFPIPIDAVRCAMALQTTFNDHPKTPVRIGIHSGTVTLEGEKIFGDSVNLASRIESLGKPSAILISKKVRDEVKNNPDLKLQLLGSFEFKNVEEPMEVFALANEGFAIPKKENMQGKLATTAPKQLVFVFTLVSLLAFVALWFGLSKNKTAYTPNDKSIAVLPFKDMSQQKDQEYFSDGVAEEILNALSKLEDLKVAGRISSFSFKNKNEISISEIGQQLNVSTILNESIRKSGDRIRVTANLVDAASGFQIWSEVYEEELKDIFSVQEKIARNIVQKFQLSQPLGEPPQLIAEQTSNLEAYEQYLKGKFYLSKTWDGMEQAQQAFENAIQLDSNYALAYSGLAGVYWGYGLSGLADLEESFENMKMAAEKTIELEPQLSTGYKYLGFYYGFYEFDRLKSIEYVKKSIELNPYDGEAQNFIPVLSSKTNEDLERAIKFNEEIVAKDPLSIEALLNLNRAYLWAGKYDKVIKNAKRAFELNPKQRSNMRHISEAYLFSGQPEKAIVYTEQAIQRNNYAFYNYILNLVQLGRMEEAKDKFNQQKKSMRADSKALCYFALKEPDKGFEYLEQARSENNPYIIFYKFWLPIQDYKEDPRFKAFETKLFSIPLKD